MAPRASSRSLSRPFARVTNKSVTPPSVNNHSPRKLSPVLRATSVKTPNGALDAANELSLAKTFLNAAGKHLEQGGLTLPLADVELRAELDGTVMRVHRGVLAMHSRVFSAALKEADSKTQHIVVSGKSGADLMLMLSWMYRCENITTVRAGASSLLRLAKTDLFPSCRAPARPACANRTTLQKLVR